MSRRMIPHRTPFFLPLLYPSLIWRMPSVDRDLYLTFDDGPINGPTEFVLEVLAKASVKATFFCIGDNIRKHPAVFKNVISKGHAIGNHTFNHLNGWKTSTEAYVANAKLFEDQLPASFPKTTMFRPPYGRISRTQMKALQNYKIVMWDVLSQDYNQNLKTENCLRRTIAATRPGSIVVFHDSLKSERNLHYVLPRFIEQFLERGYTFKPLVL